MDLAITHSNMMATVLEMTLAYNIRFGPWRNATHLAMIMFFGQGSSCSNFQSPVVISCISKFCQSSFINTIAQRPFESFIDFSADLFWCVGALL